MVFQIHRGRRLRKGTSIRESIAETQLSCNDLVMPYFVEEKNKTSPIKSMIGIQKDIQKRV